MNIVEPILFQARCQPEAPALCAQGIDVISYARLAAQMNSVARRAMSQGLKRGDVVVLSIDQPLLHAVVILGLTQAGIIPVSVAGNRASVGLRIDAVIANAVYPFARHVLHLALDYSWLAGDGASIHGTMGPDHDSDEVCRIVLTSGTTGEPRAVALTHRLVMARIAAFTSLMGNRLPKFSRFFMNVGLASSYGYYFLLYVLARGGTLFFYGESLENTLRSFEIFRIEGMVATPGTLAQLLTMCDQHPSIEIGLDTIICSGSIMTPALTNRIMPRLCSHLFSWYGTAEVGRCASAPTQCMVHVPQAVGFLEPGVRVEIVDDADRLLPAGGEGVVRIASPYAVDRYIDDPVESSKVFRNGWFYPGDIGTLTADNVLIISGRANDVLNAGGGKITAEAVEAALVTFKGVSEAAVFIATSARGVAEVWAGIVCGEGIDIESLRAHCGARLPTVFIPAHIVRIDALPLNATGKVDRARLKEMLLSLSRS